MNADELTRQLARLAFKDGVQELPRPWIVGVLQTCLKKDVDARHKAGHDGEVLPQLDRNPL
jgi:hypothetical protein